MKCKFFHSSFTRFASGLSIIFLVMIFNASAFGQINISGYSDAARQRLLIRITAHYIHTVSQGQIDMDSAVRIPCKLYGLSPFLAYNEGYSDGKPSPGSSLLDAGKVKEARALLTNLQEEARLRLLLELGTYFVFKPGTEKADLDEASKYINEALAISENKSAQWKIESLTLYAFFLAQSGLTNESKATFAKIVELSAQSKNTRALAQALLSAGRLYYYGDSLRLQNFERALTIFRTLQAKEKEIETLSEINVEHFVSRHYDTVEQVSLKILDLKTQINFQHLQYVYDALAYQADKKGDISLALSYSRKSLDYVKSEADSVFISFFYARQANIYDWLSKYDEALMLFDKALENRSKENKLYWYKSFIRKVKMLNFLGRPGEALSLLREIGSEFPPVTTFEKMYFAISLGEAYQGLKKFDAAEVQYELFLKLAGDFPVEYTNGEFPDALNQLSTFYRTMGKTSKAKALLERGKPFSFQMGPLAKGNYYNNLFKIDSTEKKYLDAIKDLQLSQEFLDSAFSDDQQKKTSELLVKYEAEKKDNAIKMLNNQNQLHLIRVEEANRSKNITLAGVVLLMIIVGLLFNRYLIKQRSNRKLEANQKELDQKNAFLETLNAEQDKLLKEKEWLIREVHHRVKNNLQMVTSLLNTQSAYLKDEAAILAVEDSLRRMQAMSMIHQKLYQDENVSTISMPEYINELVRYLYDSFDIGNQIVFEQTIEPLDLDVAQAIPLGLIINESVVNAIKYAFLNGQKGNVHINLQQDGRDHFLLSISDNGIGLPADLDIVEYSSLGLDLMKGLAEQLNGKFTVENNNGVNVKVRFATLDK